MKLKMVGILVIYNILIIYIGWNAWFFIHPFVPAVHPSIYFILVFLFSYSFVIGRIVHAFSWLRIIGSLWFGFIQYAVLVLPLANLSIFLLFLASIPKETTILWVGNITLIAFGIIFSYGMFNAYSPVVRHYSISIPKKAGLKKLHIVMASDMHFGSLSGVSHLKRLISKVKMLNPDLILLPGDIIDDDPTIFIKKKMGKWLSELQAPLGVFGVLGNHEYYGGEIPRYVDEMKNIHIRILMDEIVKLDGIPLYLIGRKDKTDKNRKSFEELMVDLDKNFPIIAMDHQPSQLNQAEAAGVDLLFSGHTHRGQMAPNHLITKRMFELDWGYLKKNNLHVFVSSGFGFWGPPLRIGSRSEILSITVNFDEKNHS